MSKVVCPGSFDPLTLGHIDVIKSCAEVFDYVYVVIGHNPEKKGMLTPELRLVYARDAFRGCGNVEVVLYDGLITDFACEHSCDAIVKGIRNAQDLEYENQMSFANNDISLCKYGRPLKTLYFPSNPSNMYVSSSFVRQLVSLNIPADKYLHNPALLSELINK